MLCVENGYAANARVAIEGQDACAGTDIISITVVILMTKALVTIVGFAPTAVARHMQKVSGARHFQVSVKKLDVKLFSHKTIHDLFL